MTKPTPVDRTEYTQVRFHLHPENLDKLSRVARKEGVALSAILDELIEDCLEE